MMNYQTKEMFILLNCFTDVKKKKKNKPGLTQTIRHKIKLISAVPINKKQYTIPHNLKQELNKEVDKVLGLGLIEQSEFPYCLPLVLVKQAYGVWRVFIDFRGINSLSEFDAEPMPSTENAYFSELYLCKGYGQVPLSVIAKFILPLLHTEVNVLKSNAVWIENWRLLHS